MKGDKRMALFAKDPVGGWHNEPGGDGLKNSTDPEGW